MSDPINPQHYKHLPAEAIDIIMAAIAKAPSNESAYLQGQVLKYLLRCWEKKGIEDLRKAKWYLDRMVNDFDDLLAEASGANETPSKPKPSRTQPPKGYRFLTQQDFWAKLDEFVDATGKREAVPESLVGQRVDAVEPHGWIRRCEFERGERVAIQFVDGIYTINGKEPGYIDCYSVQLDGFSSRKCRTVDAKNLIPLEQPTPTHKRYREPTRADLKNGPVCCEVRDWDSEQWKARQLIQIHESGPFRFLCKNQPCDNPLNWNQCRIEVTE